MGGVLLSTQREALDKWVRGLESTTPLIGGWIRRRSLDRLLRENSPEAVRLLAEFIASRPEDSPAFAPVLQELARVVSQNCRDAICDVWSRTRSRTLSELIQQQSWIAGAPPQVRVLTALLCKAPASLAREAEQVAPALFEALEDPNSEIAAQAREWLLKPPNPALQTAFMELAMLAEGPGRQAILEAGHLPKDPERRALFLFLTGQDAAFEALDFDFSLISKAYRVAAPALRSGVNQRLRQCGRPDLLVVLAGSSDDTHSSARTWGEWETVFEVLSAAGKWDDLWKHAFEAPLEWGARVMRLFQSQGLQPPEIDRDAFRELAALLPEPDELRRLGFEAPVALSQRPRTILSVAGSRAGDRVAVVALGKAPTLWELPQPHQRSRPAPKVAASTEPSISLSAPENAKFATVRVAPDGHWIAALGGTGDVCLWDQKGELLRHSRLPVREDSVTLAFVADGIQLAIMLRWEVLVWNVRKPQDPDLTLRANGGSNLVMAVSADGQTLVTGQQDGTVCVWVMPAGRRSLTQQMKCPIAALHVSARHILAADERGTICAWDRDRGELIRRWEIQHARITNLAVSPNETWLAAACKDQPTRLHHFDSDEACKQPACGGGDLVSLGFLSEDCLILCPRKRPVVIWNPELGQIWYRPVADFKRAATLWLDPVHEQFAVGGSEGIVRFFQAISTGPRSIIDPDALIRRLRPAEDPRTVRALKFALALLRHPSRFDIVIEDAGLLVPELFDIEIEG